MSSGESRAYMNNVCITEAAERSETRGRGMGHFTQSQVPTII